jgi:hypothetical protein
MHERSKRLYGLLLGVRWATEALIPPTATMPSTHASSPFTLLLALSSRWRFHSALCVCVCVCVPSIQTLFVLLLLT